MQNQELSRFYVNRVLNYEKFNKMSAEQMVEFIQSIEDWFDRGEFLFVLEDYIKDNPKIEQVIIEMLNDRNYMVRSDACELLYHSESPQVLTQLMKRLRKERSSLVRMYLLDAIRSSCHSLPLQDDEKLLLLQMYKREKAARVIIQYDALFYVLFHDAQYIQNALQYLNDDDYHIRCIVIQTLSAVLDSAATEIVLHAYLKRKEEETSYAVISILDKEIQRILT